VLVIVAQCGNGHLTNLGKFTNLEHSVFFRFSERQREVIPICVQRDNLERKAGQARRYGMEPFEIGTTERKLVLAAAARHCTCRDALP
jgi:hypothetical protein